MSAEGRISGARMNRILERVVERYYRALDITVKGMTVDGYAPFTHPLTPFEQYQRLTIWRNTGDPNYTQNPDAQARLRELEQRYGVAPQPMPGQLPIVPQQAPQQVGGGDGSA